MMGIGFPELMIILVIIMIIFGAGKLPEIGSAFGRSIKNFKSSMKEAEAEELETDTSSETVATEPAESSEGAGESQSAEAKEESSTAVKTKAAKKEVRIDITEVGKSKSRIRFKFPDKNDYTIEKMREMFEIAFAENKAELRGSEETAQIDLGMTIEEVIKLLGKPKIRMNLGTKTVLTYDDLKLIFKDGKLKDVQ